MSKFFCDFLCVKCVFYSKYVGKGRKKYLFGVFFTNHYAKTLQKV